MAPRSRSRSASRQRSYSRSPEKRTHRRHRHYSRSVSRCRNPPSPPPLPPARYDSRQSNGNRRRSLSRSPPSPPRYSRRQVIRRHDPKSDFRRRSRSRTPYDKHNRERPSPSRCIGVFGLSVNTSQFHIRDLFSKFGPIERIQVVTDAQTRRSRGFCFIYYEKIEDAATARDACCGMVIDDRRIRVAYSITHRAHTPTPGIYKGQATKQLRDRYREQRRHSPTSPRNGDIRGRYERGRSRSRSPRRYR